MPNTASAKKALRSSERKRVFNQRQKEKMKKAVKTVRDLVAAKKAEEARKNLPLAYKAIDKAEKGGLIKDNTAARKKSRLNALVKKSL